MENVLKDFLKEHRSEVVKVTQLDYTFDRQIELERIDARREGLQEGIEQGIEQGREQGIRSLVEICQMYEISYEKTKMSLRDKFQLSEEKAEEFMEKFWR